ncbi:MAG: threonylcarbamoyl-AMP synthase [Bacilli bacterium]|nr:threonylcarbamoyl-AMP synthase [Bacilli bacterium]
MIKITANDLIKLSKEEILGKVIVFPTDTVYGIGALAKDEEAINKIYNLKHRDKTKPLAYLSGNKEDIMPYIQITYQNTMELMNYWPGALTLIFKKEKDLVEKDALPTIGFRIPDSKCALKILNHFGIMAVTSMNLSGSAPLNDLESIEENFKDEIDYLVIDEEIQSKTSSTILDISTSEVKILRKGDLLEKINV